MSDQKVNVYWHDHKVSTADREKLMGHKGVVIWFTGLSACGKSTIANTVDNLLHSEGKRSYLLDGDNVRLGLNPSPDLLVKTRGYSGSAVTGETPPQSSMPAAISDPKSSLRLGGAWR